MSDNSVDKKGPRHAPKNASAGQNQNKPNFEYERQINSNQELSFSSTNNQQNDFQDEIFDKLDYEINEELDFDKIFKEINSIYNPKPEKEKLEETFQDAFNEMDSRNNNQRDYFSELNSYDPEKYRNNIDDSDINIDELINNTYSSNLSVDNILYNHKATRTAKNEQKLKQEPQINRQPEIIRPINNEQPQVYQQAINRPEQNYRQPDINRPLPQNEPQQINSNDFFSTNVNQNNVPNNAPVFFDNRNQTNNPQIIDNRQQNIQYVAPRPVINQQAQQLEDQRVIESQKDANKKKTSIKEKLQKIELPKVDLSKVELPKVDLTKTKQQIEEKTHQITDKTKLFGKNIKETFKTKKKPKKDNNSNQKPEKPDKDKGERPKASKAVKTWATIVSICAVIFIMCCIGAGVFAAVLCDNKPELNVSDLVSPDSTAIYDLNGERIMQVGMYLRENIDYDEMPNCLIDAFVAIEDSRFFEHFGFDIPRFTKSAIGYVINGGEFAQGGSTLTMQLIKNSYFTIDAGEDSTIAEREGMGGVKRKMQEIILSLQLELFTDETKQAILAKYINKVNYGDNIRGIEKAAEYYFGKSAKELNLSESAFLAGIVNSPASYNPYGNIYKKTSIYYDEDKDYLESATQRRNEVLNLMLSHGYISEKECDLAKSIKIEDLLVGPSDDFGSTNDKYQWYIDAVIDEVEEMTGDSPYSVGMNIYTNMNPVMQEFIYDVQNEEEYTNIKYPNELCQSAIVLMDNQTGAIEALGGGRGEVDSARQFNRATSAYLNPGSSFKPIVDYSLAIEKLGWATSHTLTDQPYYFYDGNILVSNFDGKYYGDMMMTEALGRSQNTPAVQTLVAVVDEMGEDGVIDYLNSIGFDFDYEDFDLQFAIGGNRCLVTPVQLAAAHAIFMNGGMYIKPHTVNYIEYVDGRDNYIADTVGTRALTEETAWIMSYLERYNMEGSFSSLMWYCKRKYPLYGKTGTTDWADSGVDYGIPVSAIKDSWLVMQTNRYTISCWTGYDQLEKGAYFSSREYQENTKSKIVSAILDQLEVSASYKEYDPSIELVKPEGVVEISSVKGTYPYAKSGGEMVKGYMTKTALEKHPLVSIEESYRYSNSIRKDVNAGISNINGRYDGNTLFVNFEVGGGEGGLLTGESVDLSTTNVYGETTHAAGRIWFPHWVTVYTGSVTPPFYFRVKVNGQVTAEGAISGYAFTAPAPGGNQAEACLWAADGNETCQTIPIS